MRPIRFIQLDNYPYYYISVTSNENKMVVRLLQPLPKSDVMKRINISSSEILTTNSILWKVGNFNGEKYQIVGEGIFDKTSKLGKKWWKPNANIQFVVNPVTFNIGRIEVISKREVSFDNGEKSPDWLRRMGYTGIAQVFCQSSLDSVEEASKSFTCNKKGKVFTNIAPERIVFYTSKDMEREDRSEFLILQHNLIVPKEIPSNTTTECYVEIYKENKGIPATNVNNEYLIIESSAGYIPNKKVHILNGKGKFKINSLLLSPGDTIELSLKDESNFVLTTNSIKVI